MSFSSVTDVAIGLAFTYFLLALIASGVQELLAGVFAWRGTYLSKAIDVIIDNRETAQFKWVSFRDRLRAHFTPSPGMTLAQVMRLGGAPPNPALQRVLGLQSHPLLRSTPSNLPSYVPARNFALALLEVLQDGSKAPLISQAERSVAALPSGDLKKTLSLFLQDAGGDLDKFRAHLERWFDDAMDRVSGIYKRWSQYVLVVLGLSLAIALNVDTFRLARTLWTDPTERAAVAEQATQARMPVAGPAAQQISRAFETATHDLPIGWHFGPSASPSTATDLPTTVGAWLVTAAGWLITALAVGLGAPFWFGLIQNLTNTRTSGARPARADDPKATVQTVAGGAG